MAGDDSADETEDYEVNYAIDPLLECRHDLQAELKVQINFNPIQFHCFSMCSLNADKKTKNLS